MYKYSMKWYVKTENGIIREEKVVEANNGKEAYYIMDDYVCDKYKGKNVYIKGRSVSVVRDVNGNPVEIYPKEPKEGTALAMLLDKIRTQNASRAKKDNQ